MNEIIDYVMNSPQNTNPNVLKGLLESYEGGGTSDFTTAEVTITNNLSNRVEFSVPFIGRSAGKTYAEAAGVVGPTLTTTLTTILYKGVARFNVVTPLGEGNEVTTTGSIVDVGVGFNIQGIGTITIGTAS